MLNAAQEQFGANSFASSNTSSSTTTTTPSNTENREPLPNPWARSANPANNSSQTPGAGLNSATNQTGAPMNFLNNPAMQTAMEQFAANPSMFQNLLSNPAMQNMMQVLYLLSFLFLGYYFNFFSEHCKQSRFCKSASLAITSFRGAHARQFHHAVFAWLSFRFLFANSLASTYHEPSRSFAGILRSFIELRGH